MALWGVLSSGGTEVLRITGGNRDAGSGVPRVRANLTLRLGSSALVNPMEPEHPVSRALKPSTNWLGQGKHTTCAKW